MLGLACDVRHAAQGDREVYTEANGLSDWRREAAAETGGPPLSEQNLRYACNVLYPEVILMTMALNGLIQFRMNRLARSRHGFEAPLDTAVVNDRAIALARVFRCLVAEAVGAVLSKPSFCRWQNIVHDRMTDVAGITHPFVDTWVLRYLNMDRDTRAKKLVTITKRFAEHLFDQENREYRRAIDEAVQECQCAEADQRFPGLEYPEEIAW